MENTNRLRSAEPGITSSGRKKKPEVRQFPSLLHDNPCCSRPIRPSTKRFSSIHWSLQARSFSLHGRVSCLISYCARPTRALSGRALHEHRRSTDHSPHSFQARSFLSSEGGLVDPQMRASNEHLPSVRVPRARGRPGCPPHPLTPTPAHTPSPLLFLRTIDTGPATPPA